MELKNVNPAYLHQFWDTITPGLLECMESDDSDVRLEDVYTQIKTEKAYLLIGSDNGEYIGFLVIQPGQDPFSGANRIHIWFLYSIPGKSVLEEGEAQLMKLAKAANAQKITFMSPRKGFEKLSASMGYKPSQILYMKRL